jgi:hypothetical protein
MVNNQFCSDFWAPSALSSVVLVIWCLHEDELTFLCIFFTGYGCKSWMSNEEETHHWDGLLLAFTSWYLVLWWFLHVDETYFSQHVVLHELWMLNHG